MFEERQKLGLSFAEEMEESLAEGKRLLNKREREEKERKDWNKTAAYIIEGVLKKNKKAFDGLIFNTSGLHFSKLILRKDGKFNVEVLDGRMNLHLRSKLFSNNSRGYSSKEIVYAEEAFKDEHDTLIPSFAGSEKGKENLIKEIKKRTGVDLTLEVNKRLNVLKAQRRGSSVMGLICMISSVFFFAPNVTGNIILEIGKNTSNMLGFIFLILGIVFGFIYVLRK
jgi:hypothetical protein